MLPENGALAMQSDDTSASLPAHEDGHVPSSVSF